MKRDATRIAFKVAKGWYDVYEKDGTYLCCVTSRRELRDYDAEITTVGAAVNREAVK